MFSKDNSNYNIASKAVLLKTVYISVHHNPIMHAHKMRKVNFASPDTVNFFLAVVVVIIHLFPLAMF